MKHLYDLPLTGLWWPPRYNREAALAMRDESLLFFEQYWNRIRHCCHDSYE